MAITSDSPRIDIRVEKELYDSLQDLAKRHDRPFPNEVRRALRLYVLDTKESK